MNSTAAIQRRDIEQALSQAHLPSLVMALIHMTGRADLLATTQRPVYDFFGDGQGGLPDDQAMAIRALAADAIEQHLLHGMPTASLDQTTVRAMMNYIAGVDIPEHYTDFLTDELSLEDHGANVHVADVSAPKEALAAFHVVIAGAGMSGLLAGIQLKKAGVPFTIIEKNADVGGTWLENSYPGCRVDTPNHLYSYSFEADYKWPQHYSTQDILLGYFRHIADKYDLRPHIRFNTSIDEARFDAETDQWQITLRNKSAESDHLSANVFISAVGQLNQPRLPDIPAREKFTGPAFHSAQWRHDIDFSGKRVAVIGTGASAFQFVPEIADACASLHVFQRSAPWLGPTPDYHMDVGAGEQWLFDHVPFYRKWYRFWLFWMLTDSLIPFVTADENWQGNPNFVGALNQELGTALLGQIQLQTGEDADLYNKVAPDYPIGGKRSLRDNGVWLAALKKPHVHLLTDRITAIAEKSVVLENGTQIEVDCLIYGTGFYASRFLWPMRIIGKSGTNIHDAWAGDARAYLGMTIPDYPNFFCIYGPNTNIVVNGSIIFFSECSVNYIMGCIKAMLEKNIRSLECRPDVHEAFNAKVDAENAKMAWGAPGVSSWYKNATGRVSQNWPFPLVDYWQRTRSPALNEFLIKG